tara:strand:+ start:641 stop:1009 length:369 start_codon:yes stop_codon:yes gene_type:complete
MSLGLAAQAISENNKDVLECADFIVLAEELREGGVRMIDEVTEFVDINVSCPTKTITYFKRVYINKENFPEEWTEGKQVGHTEIHCSENGSGSMLGWTTMDIIYDIDFQYMGTFATSSSDCS